MSVRAEWGTAAVAAPEPSFDPFSLAQSSSMDNKSPVKIMPASADKPLDLSTPVPELRAWLGELIRREANLFDCGATCPLRDKADGNCTACPVSRAHETSGSVEDLRLAGLCRVGAEQERVAMVLLTKQHRGI